MNHVTIVVPTRHRYEKLARMMATIDYPCRLFIVCDGDEETHKQLALHRPPLGIYLDMVSVRIVVTKEHIGSVACRNRVMAYVEDGLLYATDDVTFRPGAIAHLVEEFNGAFPDDDGVLGVMQACQHHPSGMALVGRPFLERYPDRKLFFPDYFHFAAQEVYEHAASVGKFLMGSEVAVDHYHPAFVSGEMDETHREARRYKEEDHRLMRERRSKGLIWGLDEEMAQGV